MGSQGRVLAFEPNPATFRILAEHSLWNSRLGHIFPIPLALGTETSAQLFEYGDYWLDNGGDHKEASVWTHGSNYSVPVNSVRLNEFLEDFLQGDYEKLAFVKLDCEGSDMEILYQFIKSWRYSIPIFQIEILDIYRVDANLIGEIEQTFDLFKIESSTLCLQPFDLDKHLISELTDLICIPKGCSKLSSV